MQPVKSTTIGNRTFTQVVRRCQLLKLRSVVRYFAYIFYVSCLFFVHCQQFQILVFTARCTLVQSAVLRSHVICVSVCLSVCPSVTLVDCDHIGWNSSKLISPLVSLGCSLFATPAMLEKFQVAISPQPVVRSTSCFVLGLGFRGRRI